MAPAVCISNGTQRHPYCRPIGGPVGFDSQGQRTMTHVPRTRVLRCTFLYHHGTHPKAQVRLAAAGCLHTAVALELSAGQMWAAGMTRNLRTPPARPGPANRTPTRRVHQPLSVQADRLGCHQHRRRSGPPPVAPPRSVDRLPPAGWTTQSPGDGQPATNDTYSQVDAAPHPCPATRPSCGPGRKD